jgi:hypothetical protein
MTFCPAFVDKTAYSPAFCAPGHFLLTQRLIPALDKTAAESGEVTRVVHVSSEAQKGGKFGELSQYGEGDDAVAQFGAMLNSASGWGQVRSTSRGEI